eukprot:scpid65108/ scgid26867/ Hormonally up-regulated neu tumor-associated kinase; Serine/threonine-protein kinase MAK-V
MTMDGASAGVRSNRDDPALPQPSASAAASSAAAPGPGATTSVATGTSSGATTSAAPATAAPTAAVPAAGGRVESKVKVIGNYVLTGKTLGKGNFARVEEAQHTACRAKVAIKIINTDRIKEEYVKKNLLREAYIMRRLNHPNIVRLYETMKTRSLYCLVTECAEGGELLMHVKNDHGAEKRLPESSARPFVRQLMSALQYMHEMGIVHRDLKMENILLDKTKKHIKIVDFGLSNTREPGEFLSTHCGSPEYAAPELFVPGKVYGQEVDVWSLGVNMFAMLAGRLPFRVPRQGPSRRQRLLEQISNGIGPTQEQEGAHISAGAMDLIRQLLKPDPTERPTIVMAMKHKWITKNDLYPMQPYQEDGVDPSQHDRILDLICARLDVTRRQVSQSVSECRCDWVAAIYHLLHDQPEGQTTMRDRTRQQIAQLLKTSTPGAGSSSGAAAAAKASEAAAAAAAQQQPLRASVRLPTPSSGATVAGAAPAMAVSSEGQTTAAQVTTVNAVVRKLEAAAGQQLKTRPAAVKRHDSTSRSARPGTQGGSGLTRRHTFTTQRSREDQTDGGERSAAQMRQQQQLQLLQQRQHQQHQQQQQMQAGVSAASQHNAMVAQRTLANAADTFPVPSGGLGSSSKGFSTPPIGSPIRTALKTRESLSTTHASTTNSSSHVVTMAQRFGRQLSTPAINSSGASRHRHESPHKAHQRGQSPSPHDSPTKAGENIELPTATPRKKVINFLRTRKTSKEKTSPIKYDPQPADSSLQVLNELSETSNKMSSDHVSQAGAASLSRSFALKPRVFTSGDHANSLALRQPLSKSAQFATNSTTSTGGRPMTREGAQSSFGQQAPSYGQRQGGLTPAWTQPAFTAVYNKQSPPSLRRTASTSRSRPRSVAAPNGNPPFANRAFVPTETPDIGELPPPVFRYSDHAMEETQHEYDEYDAGNTLPSRSRRPGAFGGIFGKALRMKKQNK